MKRYICLALIPMILLPLRVKAADDAIPTEFKGSTPLQWSVRMADAQMARRAQSLLWTEGGRKKWDYADNVFLLAIIHLSQQINNPKYTEFADRVASSFIEADGSIKTYNADDYTLDNLNGGKTLLALFENNKDDGYRLALQILRKQLDTQPRTDEGGFWHKKIYPNQMWLDGLYMAGPFLAQYGKDFDQPDDFNEATKQLRLVADHTYDPKTGLFYHGWDSGKIQPWANKETGDSPSFWSRSIGWYAMALVDTLDFLPKTHPAYPDIVALLNRVCDGVRKHQDASGLWWQVTDQGNRPGNYLEATGSCMFVYTMAKGVNKGYLAKEYVPTIVKGYTGIVEKLIKTDANGVPSLTQCCSVAGLGPGNTRNGTFDYYIHEPIVENDMKGVGPFIMAGMEMQKLSEMGQMPVK